MIIEGHQPAAATTMFVFYELPSDYPGRDTCPVGSPRTQAEHLEGALKAEVGIPTYGPSWF